MISPLARGLFHRAIGQSGGMFSGGPGLVYDLKSAESVGVSFAEQFSDSTIAGLRTVSAEDLMKVRGRSGVTTDNIVVPPATETFWEGRQNDVPLLAGWNADDGVSMGSKPDIKAFIANAESRYGELAPEYLKLFPANNEAEVQNSMKLSSVLSFGWQNYTWVKLQTETGKNKAYLYYFTHVPPGEPNYGAFHSAEFGYALNTLKLWDRPFTETDWKLADIMSSYWVNFARTGDPNGEGLPDWPAFDPASPKIIEFGDEVKSAPLPFREQLEFFDRNNKR